MRDRALFPVNDIVLIHSRLAWAGSQPTHGSRDRVGVVRNRRALRLGSPGSGRSCKSGGLDWMWQTVSRKIQNKKKKKKKSYSQRMTPSFRPCWKLSPMHIPVVSSIQKRSSSSLCGSYFWAIWNTEGDKFYSSIPTWRPHVIWSACLARGKTCGCEIN